jgi:hypothetical protein
MASSHWLIFVVSCRLTIVDGKVRVAQANRSSGVPHASYKARAVSRGSHSPCCGSSTTDDQRPGGLILKTWLHHSRQASNSGAPSIPHLAKTCGQAALDLRRSVLKRNGKGGLARGSRVCHEGWDRQVSAARSPQNLCTALLRCRRRTGANPVSARSRFDSDH